MVDTAPDQEQIDDKMEDITLKLAILLGGGFLAAKIGQFFRLPSVTGYICVGLLVGPSGLNLINEETIVYHLGHFTQIALMLIAFGIGEHLELKRLRHTVKNIVFISIADVMGAFLVVSSVMFLIMFFFKAGADSWTSVDYFVVAILLGTVSMATAPAAILHVMRELRASGKFTTSLLQVVAVDNGLAIMTFGVAVAVASTMIGKSSSILGGIAFSLVEILLSLMLGVVTGLLIDFVFQKLKRRGEMLTAGLSLLLLCGESARILDLSPLLAGMAVGFIIVNRDHRDVRLFRVLNAFEAPIYVLFFTLAGAHLDLSSLNVAGWLGLLYFFLRTTGKYFGANGGARLIGASPAIRQNVGPALIPQAGIAIGLIILITGDPALRVYSPFITPIVLAGVFLSELIGPVCTRLAVQNAGEIRTREHEGQTEEKTFSGSDDTTVKGSENVELAPWTWGVLQQPEIQEGSVIFGAAHSGTVAGLARMSTLLAHYYGARPLAVRIVLPGSADQVAPAAANEEAIFDKEKTEVRVLGYELDTAKVKADNVADGLLAIARERRARAIVLGYPLKGTAQEFQSVVEAVAGSASCQVIVIRFSGPLHTERILVPVAGMEDLHMVRDVVCALAGVGQHRIRLLHLLPSDIRGDKLLEAEAKMLEWLNAEKMAPCVQCRSVATEARLETVLEESDKYDFLIMAASRVPGLQRLFFGSLAGGVSQRCPKPLMMVYGPRIEAP